MKANFKILFLLVCVVGLSSACKKIDNGFLSDGIRYKDNTIYCKRGMSLIMSDRINTDGSTPPYQFELQNLRNASTDEPAPDVFFKQFDILTFKPGMVFNAETDTTVELLNKKRETVKKAPMEFNTVSGQLVFNRTSANLPLGRYNFDVKMTNPRGQKVFPKLATIEVIDPSIDDMFKVTYQAASGSSLAEVFTGIAAPKIKCTKVSNEGARVVLKIVDKNGVAFNPKNGEIVKRGDRPMFETHVKFNPVQITENALICDYEVAPFPLAKYIDRKGTDWGYLIYYRIPMKYAQVDGLPANNVNPVFGFQLLMEGTYEVEVKLPAVTRIAQ